MTRRRRDPINTVYASVSVIAFIVLSVVLSVSSVVANADAAEKEPSTVHARTKRQLPPLEEGNQVIDNIFQIPISTLNAVGSLIKSTRPLVRRTRERIQQYYNNGQLPASQYQQQQQQRPQYSYNNPVQYGGNNRPYYYGGGGNRKKQQRDEPPAEGRRHHSAADDY